MGTCSIKCSHKMATFLLRAVMPTRLFRVVFLFHTPFGSSSAHLFQFRLKHDNVDPVELAKKLLERKTANAPGPNDLTLKIGNIATAPCLGNSEFFLIEKRVHDCLEFF
jgi:hypothetical protein